MMEAMVLKSQNLESKARRDEFIFIPGKSQNLASDARQEEFPRHHADGAHHESRITNPQPLSRGGDVRE